MIRQRNKAAAAAKERGEALAFGRRRAMPLECIIDVSDIDTVLQRATEADQLAEATSVSSDSDLVIDLDATEETTEERRRLRKEQEALHAGSLRVLRRPPWHNQMTVEELDANERRVFLVWCRNLARLVLSCTSTFTPTLLMMLRTV